MKESLKKVSLGTLMFVMVAVLSFGTYVPKASSALATGDLVKGPNSDAVYYINGSNKHVFPDRKTYLTWYTNFNAVKKVTVAELDQFTTGAPVAYRPGTKLVTHPNTAKVYAVEPGGGLRWLPSEAAAVALYGNDWAKWVNDVHELTFGNYTIGSDLTSTMHAKGTVLQKTGDTTIYYYDGTNIRPFASSAAFDANTLNYDYIVKVGSLSQYTAGSSVTAAETFATIAGVGTGPVPGAAGTLTISLSPTTPPANTVLIGSASRVPMTTMRLVTGGAAVIVDSVAVERMGIAQDGAFSNFDLLRSDTMLPLNASSKSLNANHQAIFNDDFTVPANSTWDVIAAANMISGALSSYAGEYPVISFVTVTLKSGSTLSGTLPLTGNVMLVNGTLTAGAAAVAVGANEPSATTKEVGTKDYIVSSIKITNNSTATNQDMTLKSVTWTQNGSASPGDVENVELVNANTGAVLATVAAPTEKKIHFTGLSVEIKRGDSLNLNLRLDMKTGSSRTISYDIDQQADVVVYDKLRSTNLLPTYPNTSAPFYNATNTTIGDGKLRIESIAVSPTNIPENSKKVRLGSFKFVMEGEAGNITSIGFKIATSAATGVGKFTNCQMINPAGATVAGPKDATLNSGGVNGATATTTDTITVPVGETTYNIHCDLDADFASNNTVQVTIFPGTITIKGDTSGNTITPTPSGGVNSTQLTVKSAALAVSLGSAPSAQTVVAGSTDFEFGRIVFDASNSGTDVRVTQFAVDVRDTDAFPNIVTGIEIFDGSTKVPVSSSSQTCSGASCSTINTRATTTLSIDAGNLTITKGNVKEVRLIGDIGTASTTGSFRMQLQGGNVTAIDSEAQSVTPTYTTAAAAIMTLAAGGTLNVSVAQDPKAALAVGGTTVNVGQFTMQPKNEAMTINSFALNIGNPDNFINATNDFEQVERLEVWESGGAAALGGVTVNAAANTVTPATPIALALNQEKTYVVKAKIRDVTTPSVAESATGFAVTMSHVDAKGQAAGSSTITLNGTGTAFKTFTSFKSVPTIALSSITVDQLTSSSSVADIFKFSAAASTAGPIALSKFTFDVSTSTSVRVNTAAYLLYESDSSGSLGTLLTDTGDFVVSLTGGNAGTTIHQVEARFDVNNDSSQAYNAVDKGEHLIINAGGTKYFTFRGTMSNISSTANDDSVSTQLGGDNTGITAVSNHGAIDNTLDQDDFIWSDLNFDQYATSTATQNGGWFNGYRVSGMNDTSSTAQVQTD